MFKINYNQQLAQREASDHNIINKLNKSVNDEMKAAIEKGESGCRVTIEEDIPDYVYCTLVQELKQLGFELHEPWERTCLSWKGSKRCELILAWGLDDILKKKKIRFFHGSDYAT